MDLQKLKYFEAAARLNSFTGASRELSVSQPAISKAVKELERDYGVTLFERNTRNLILTPAGKILLTWARKILDDVAGCEHELAEFSSSWDLTLRVVIANVVGDWVYSEVYGPMIEEHPEFKISLREIPWNELLTSILDRKIDLAFSAWEEGTDVPGIDFHPVLESRLCIVAPPDHRLASFESVPLRELNGENVGLFGEGTLIHRILVREFRKSSVRPHLIPLSLGISSMINLVGNHEALGFVIQDAKLKTFRSGRFVIRPLEIPVRLFSGYIVRKNAPANRVMKTFTRRIESAAGSVRE